MAVLILSLLVIRRFVQIPVGLCLDVPPQLGPLHKVRHDRLHYHGAHHRNCHDHAGPLVPPPFCMPLPIPLNVSVVRIPSLVFSPHGMPLHSPLSVDTRAKAPDWYSPHFARPFPHHSVSTLLRKPSTGTPHGVQGNTAPLSVDSCEKALHHPLTSEQEPSWVPTR